MILKVMGSAFDMISRNRVNMRLRRSNRRRRTSGSSYTSKDKSDDGVRLRSDRARKEDRLFLTYMVSLFVVALIVLLLWYVV